MATRYENLIDLDRLSEYDELAKTRLAKKSNIGHNHNDTYYTESEIDEKLKAKADVNYAENLVLNHNTSATAHSDIRDLISGLTTRLNALADSDDITLDQLSEIVAYIKSNRTLIENVTTNKVNVADIVDNLMSTATNKPLSANQGKILNDLITTLKNTVNTKVDKVSGKGLSTNDLTDALKGNYDSAYTHSQSAHAPSNAQANVIETVKVNGTALTPSSKAVNISVPTNNNQLTNGAGYITSSGTAKTISDTLPISKGGTGKTTGVDAANVLLNSLSTGESTPIDSDYYISQSVGGGTTTTTYHRRPVSKLWDYIKSKLATVATSGSYNDLSNKPTIGNGTVTIKQAGTSKGTFKMNQTGDTVIELTDNNTTYGAAGANLGLIKSGGDLTIVDGVAQVNDDSHNHVISNVDGLQSALDWKAANVQLTNQNLNNIITPGFYNAAGGNSVINKPSGVGAFGLEVIHNAMGNYYTQILYRNDQSISYRRYCIDGTWGNWTEDKLTDTNTWRGIQNNLTSDSTTDSLSAAQGKVLKGLVDGKADLSHIHNYLPLSGGKMSGSIKFQSSSLPEKELIYICGIDAFANGGEMGWQSKSEFLSDYSKVNHAHSAYVNQNAFSNIVVGSTTVAADTATDTLTLVAGDNVTIIADANNDKITISSKDTVYTHPTTSGNKHIPSGGSAGKILRWASDGTAVWGDDVNTWRGIQDNLTSTATDQSLSANQGRLLANGSARDSTKLPLSGGTMNGTAFISWADSGNWNNSNSGVTFPVKRGGLRWNGQSDYVEMYSEETAINNLELVIKFGDDNSNGISIRNASGTQTARISATGVFTGSFSGNASSASSVPWSGVTGKPSTFTPSTHTHTKSEITDFPSSLKNPTYIIIKLNGGTTEGTDLFTYDGSSAKTINITPSSIGASASTHTHSYIPLSGSSAITGNLEFSNSGTTSRGIIGTIGDNDYWRIIGGATAVNAGFLEIATADDGNEPIYVRQYSSGKFVTLKRTLTLLDASGNTSFPGTVTGSFSGNLSGNSSTASKLATARTITLSGAIIGSVNFDGSGNVTLATSEGDVSFKRMSTQITNTTDWNTIETPGQYKVQMSSWGDASTYHSPNSYSSSLYRYGILLVFRAWSGDIEKRLVQIYLPHNSYPILVRWHNNSDITTGWGTWRPIYTGVDKSFIGLGNVENKSSATIRGEITSTNVTTALGYTPVNKAGDTMTGLLTAKVGSTHSGIKLGNTYVTAIDGDVIFQNNNAIRFGSDAWDYNVWAGLKYVSSSKAIYLGLADNSAFKANAAQSGGTIYTPGISALYVGSTKVSLEGHNHTYNVNNEWLRYNGDSSFVKLYGNSRQMVFRTDGTTQYSDNGAYPFVWAYGGDGTSYRKMLLSSGGDLWTSTNGWLSTALSGKLSTSGGTMTGNLSFSSVTSTTYPAKSNKIIWSGSTDGAEIYYQVDASDAGRLVFNLTDDANTRICFALNGTVKSYIDANGNFSGNASTSSKVYSTTTNPSTGTSYYIPFHSNASSENKSLLNNNGLRYWTIEGTTTVNGVAELALGNNVASGTAGNKIGRITLYGTSSGYTYIIPGNNSTNNITLTLPSSGGTLARTADNVASANKWATARTLTLTGSVTGSVSIDGSGNVSLATTTNHSHNYINSLGAKNPQTGRTQAYGNVYSYNTNASANTGAPTTFTSVIGFGQGASGTVEIAGEWTGGRGLWVRALRDVTDNWYDWQRIYTSNYHPLADKWATARTITLTGAVTGSVSIDGSANVSLATTVNHTHNYAGSASAGGSATNADKPLGFSGRRTNAGWGNQNGTVITDWCTANGGEIAFRENSSQLNVVIDGFYYQNEGKYKCLDENNYSSYALPISGGTMNAGSMINIPINSNLGDSGIVIGTWGTSYFAQLTEECLTVGYTDSAGNTTTSDIFPTYIESSEFRGKLTGTADKAVALTTSAGSATQPVYFKDGKPTACTYTLGKSVPSNAVFTDTKVTQDYSTANGSYPILLSATAGVSSTSSRGATTSILNNSIYVNPYTGYMYCKAININDFDILYDSSKNRFHFDSNAYVIDDFEVGGFTTFDSDVTVTNGGRLYISEGCCLENYQYDDIASNDTPQLTIKDGKMSIKMYMGTDRDTFTDFNYDGFTVNESDAYIIINYGSSIHREVSLAASAFTPYPNNTLTLGSASFKWKQLYASTTTISTSDRNEKENIETLNNKLTNDFIMGLNPVSFKFIDNDSGRTHYGLIAQDVEDLMNELGMTSKDFAGFIKSPKTTEEWKVITNEDGTKRREKITKVIEGEYSYGLRYEEFIAPVIKVIQMQESKITELENTISVQDEKIKSLEEKVNKLCELLNI